MLLERISSLHGIVTRTTLWYRTERFYLNQGAHTRTHLNIVTPEIYLWFWHLRLWFDGMKVVTFDLPLKSLPGKVTI